MNPKILEAIELAFQKYEGQCRKGTKSPYIVHPLSVMRLLLLEQASDPEITDDVVIAGVLHDAIEDTDTTLLFTQTDNNVAWSSSIWIGPAGVDTPAVSLGK